MIHAEPARDDFWRVRAPLDETPFKEWQHFIISTPELDLLVNFSLETSRTSRVGRVIVLARTARWIGFVDTVPADVSRDGCRGRFGAHRVEIVNGGYRVVVDAPRHGVAIDATFSPEVLPIVARHQLIAPGRHLDWNLTARLSVTAHVELPDATHDLTGALGYHDHNWGGFRWGDDFVWEWGCVLPRDGGDWAAVYSNLMNRARTQLALEQLLLWRGGKNVLAAGDFEVRSRSFERSRSRPALRIPSVMALLQSRTDSDVPRRLQVTARRGGDEVVLRFSPASTAQLLVPAERSLSEVITINECTGPVHIQGWIDGEAIDCEGWGVFEFVR